MRLDNLLRLAGPWLKSRDLSEKVPSVMINSRNIVRFHDASVNETVSEGPELSDDAVAAFLAEQGY